jgi:hypothetical protein
MLIVSPKAVTKLSGSVVTLSRTCRPDLQIRNGKLGFDGMEPEVTGRPAYHPATLLKAASAIGVGSVPRYTSSGVR